MRTAIREGAAHKLKPSPFRLDPAPLQSASGLRRDAVLVFLNKVMRTSFQDSEFDICMSMENSQESPGSTDETVHLNAAAPSKGRPKKGKSNISPAERHNQERWNTAIERCMVAHCSNMQDLSRRTIPRHLTGHRTTIISSPLLLLLAILPWTCHNTALTIPTLSLPHTRASITMPDAETPTGHRATVISSL
jgi:hypothetical protein